MKRFVLVAAVLTGLVAVPGSLGASRAGSALHLTVDAPCFVRGVETPVRCVAIRVPLDWGHPAQASLQIVAAVVPALSSHPAPDPLIVLAGGPGQGATAYGSLVATAFRDVHRSRDIVLFDQRGTGRSNPLNCKLRLAGRSAWPTKSDFAHAEEQCLAQLHTRPEFFGLSEAIDDLDALRSTLGYERVDLWGGSYGTRTAQAYIRRYGDRVRSVILDGALPPDRSLLTSAAVTADAALHGVWSECNADVACRTRFPDADTRFDALLHRLESAPVTATFDDPTSGRPTTATFARDTVAQTVRGALYVPALRALVPLSLDAAEHGRYEPLAALFASTAEWSSDTMALGATLSVLCADEMGRESPIAARREGVGFTRDSYYRYWAAACAAWPWKASPGDFREPLVASRVPALVLSGGLDPATPPSSGARVARQFADARHIVMPDAGHNVSFSGCVPRLIGEFLAAGTGAGLDASCVLQIRRPAMVLE